MSDANQAERQSAKFKAVECSLEAYLVEIAANNLGEKAKNVPRIISSEFQRSVVASSDYHDYMSESDLDDACLAYHGAMASAYHALKK